MTIQSLATRSALYHWRTNAAVVLGVATAVAVLAGALLVGDSVRGSLRDLALGRLGRTEALLTSQTFFRESVANAIAEKGTPAAPVVVATGLITHEESGRRASGVLVYGVDDRFWSFHGLTPPEGAVHISPSLARELGARRDDVLLARLQRPSEIPLESLFGRRDEVGRTIRLTLSSELPPERLGEFAVQPQQSEVRALFAPMRRIQRDLGVVDRVNTVLLGGGPSESILASLDLEDLGVRVRFLEKQRSLSVESGSGILGEPVQTASTEVAARLGLRPSPVFTYLANTIRSGDRSIPYSLVTALDLSVLSVPSLGPSAYSAYSDDSIVLNEWSARELGATRGAPVELEYYVWDPATGLVTHRRSFKVDAIVPIAGIAADRQLAPDYPGITGADSFADWDPPFPIDLSRVRPQDEKYWNDYRTTPKAFIGYARGREMWGTRYGAATSIRILVAEGADPNSVLKEVSTQLRAAVQPRALGVAVTPVRQAALAASTGATDFGEYFTYFSFFIVASALLLAVLFFRLGVEQRLKQIGVLRATGFPIAQVRSVLLAEAIVLAAIGSLLGVAGAIGYAHAIVYGLRTWWVGAVGTTLLQVHVSWRTLAIGAAAGVITAVLCVALSLRAVARLSPRALLTASSIEPGAAASPGRSRRYRRIAGVLGLIGLLLVGAGFANRTVQTGAFFGAGAALLAGGMLFLAAWLRARDASSPSVYGGPNFSSAWPVMLLGFRSASYRPARAVLSASLIASAAFIIVAVDAFRRGGGEIAGDSKSGTGGYVLLAKSELPIVGLGAVARSAEAVGLGGREAGEPGGRGVGEPGSRGAGEPGGREGVTVTRFRVRPGEDASCLNLYRPTNPTIVAPEPGFLESGRFSFAASRAESEEERANPWLLLRRPFADGAIPAIADATSLQYVLHASVGDDFVIETGGSPVRLRFVASLSDSVLQGEFVIAEEQFVRLFPGYEGYRLFLVDAPVVSTREAAEGLATTLERELEAFGFDAVLASDRLAAFHRVENTYLSTFQALGALGLLLGTIGLAAILFRNVLERRRELALLRAIGFGARRVSLMIVSEAVFVLAVGLLVGAGCAAIAIAPAWLGRSGTLPGMGLALLLAGVALAGMVASLVATRAALRGNMLAALRAD